ncbi:hypothetical protein AMTR_s00013p00246410, partial [Amborella trichopoda]
VQAFEEDEEADKEADEDEEVDEETWVEEANGEDEEAKGEVPMLGPVEAV